jgi:hypothetical protein
MVTRPDTIKKRGLVEKCLAPKKICGLMTLDASGTSFKLCAAHSHVSVPEALFLL